MITSKANISSTAEPAISNMTSKSGLPLKNNQLVFNYISI